MRILAFETSAKAASVAVLQDGMLLGEYMQNGGQTHSRTLMKMAQDLLQNCDLNALNVDAVACAVGPGSFTGIRIGLAAAKGFAWGREIPLIGVSTLEAMAKNVAVADGIYCAAMDARRDQVYTACFAMDGGVFHRLTDDSAISLQELQQQLSAFEQNIYLVGDGASLCYGAMSADLPNLNLFPEHLRMQRAAGTALLAWEQIQADQIIPAGDVQPNYLRLSQAERERQKKLAME